MPTIRDYLRNELRALRLAYQTYRRERTGTPRTMAEQALLQMDLERQRHDSVERQVRRLHEASRFVNRAPRKDPAE